MARTTNHSLATFVADRGHADATGSVLLFSPHHGHRRGPRIAPRGHHAAHHHRHPDASWVSRIVIWSACLLSALSASGITAFLLAKGAFSG